jgi:hypothetical protein
MASRTRRLADPTLRFLGTCRLSPISLDIADAHKAVNSHPSALPLDNNTLDRVDADAELDYSMPSSNDPREYGDCDLQERPTNEAKAACQAAGLGR